MWRLIPSSLCLHLKMVRHQLGKTMVTVIIESHHSIFPSRKFLCLMTALCCDQPVALTVHSRALTEELVLDLNC